MTYDLRVAINWGGELFDEVLRSDSKVGLWKEVDKFLAKLDRCDKDGF